MRGSFILLLFSVLTAGAAGCAWLAQISGYPLWRLAGEDALAPYVKFWNAASFGFLVLPVYLILLLALGMALAPWPTWLRPTGVPSSALWAWVALALPLAAVGVFGRFPGVEAVGSGLTGWTWLRTLLLTALVVGTTMAGVVGAAQVWMVQMLYYRLWPLVGRENFYDYHLAWWRSIWISIFIPAGVALFGCLLLLRWHPAGTRWLWVGFGLQMLLGVSTGVWWGADGAAGDAGRWAARGPLCPADDDALAARGDGDRVCSGHVGGAGRNADCGTCLERVSSVPRWLRRGLSDPL